MAWDDLAAATVDLVESETETRRFGLAISRLTIGYEACPSGDCDAVRDRVLELLTSARADVVIVRYPSAALGLASALAVSGRDVIPAGTLIYWGAEAKDVYGKTPEPDLDVVLGSHVVDGQSRESGLEQTLDSMVASSFAGYRNHYASNPLLSQTGALAGYQEWARGTLARASNDVLILRAAGVGIGLATCVSSADGISHLEILLAGLVEEGQGRGRYAALLDACARQAEARGLHRVIISTQAHNTRVQRAWMRVGLRPFAAVDTAHAVRRGLLSPAGASATGSEERRQPQER